MAKGVAPNVFDDTGFSNRLFHGPLKYGLMEMVSAFLSGCCVLPPVLLREDPLPAPLGWSVGIFSVQGMGQQNAAPAFGQVPLMVKIGTAPIYC